MDKVNVNDVVKLKTPIDGMAPNAWRVLGKSADGLVLLQHTERKIHRAFFKPEDIEQPQDGEAGR